MQASFFVVDRVLTDQQRHTHTHISACIGQGFSTSFSTRDKLRSHFVVSAVIKHHHKHQAIIFTATMPASVEFITNLADTTFDYESDPVAAMSSYSRMMHEYTKQQMDTYCRPLRRRSPVSSAVDAQTSITKTGSHSSKSSRSSF